MPKVNDLLLTYGFIWYGFLRTMQYDRMNALEIRVMISKVISIHTCPGNRQLSYKKKKMLCANDKEMKLIKNL